MVDLMNIMIKQQKEDLRFNVNPLFNKC